MARIPLSTGFVTCPEGRHIFRIEKVEYDEDFGRMRIELRNKDGIPVFEKFNLMDASGSPNAKALNAFSFFARTALQDTSLVDCDPADMVGHYIGAEVIHAQVPAKDDPTKMKTFVNLGEKWEASGFEGDAPAVPQPADEVDLGSLLDI